MRRWTIATATLAAGILAFGPLPTPLAGLGAAPALAFGTGGSGGFGGGGNAAGHSASGLGAGTGLGSVSGLGSHFGSGAGMAGAYTGTFSDTNMGTIPNAPLGSTARAGVAKVKALLAEQKAELGALIAKAPNFKGADWSKYIGKFGAYRQRALATTAAVKALNDAIATLVAASTDPNYKGRTTAEVEADIAALDPNSPTYASDKAALEAELSATEAVAAAKSAVTAAAATVSTDQTAEAEALDQVTSGQQLTPAALAYLRKQLDL